MTEHPIPKVRDALIPNTTLSVEVFQSGPSDVGLSDLIEDWVQRTGNLVVMPGPVTESAGVLRIAVSYVPATRKNNDPKREQPTTGRPAGGEAGGAIPVETKSSKPPAEAQDGQKNDAVAASLFSFTDVG